ncbi:MAG: cupin domain-containing protein [Streptosporangiaceae bacterium]
MASAEQVVVCDLVDSSRVTTFLDGSTRTLAQIGPSWVGRGTYLPGWRWSEHVRPLHGRQSESHAGYVLSGAFAVQGRDGREVVVRPGQAFYAGPGHDAWVIGDEPCEALDFPLA